MKKFIQKIIRWSFKKRLVIISTQETITDLESCQKKYHINDYDKEKISLRIFYKIMEEKLINFTDEYDKKNLQRHITGKIYILNIK